MSLRLAAASLWMPRGTMRRELLHVEEVTNGALDAALMEVMQGYAPPPLEEVGGDLERLRDRMSSGHRRRVEILIDRIGREGGIEKARTALHQAGLSLGREARGKLRLTDRPADLERAAAVLYRILGIDMTMMISQGKGEMRVRRCALSRKYSRETCMALCATDEGLVNGLNPRAEMRFQEHLTSGAPECVAILTLREGA